MLIENKCLSDKDKIQNIGNKKQVFIDGRFLTIAQGVEFIVHQARKSDEMTIYPEYPWEYIVKAYNTVLKIGDEYKMWYPGFGKRSPSDSQMDLKMCVAYATSKDGITWEKPKLGLTDKVYPKENNIVLGYGAGGVEESCGDGSAMVFIDSNAKEEERFRMIARPGHVALGAELGLFSSPDGIHWKFTREKILTDTWNRKDAVFWKDPMGRPLGKEYHLDSQNVILWDNRIQKYVAYIRKNIPPYGRTIARSESDDLFGFPEARKMPVVLMADDYDAPMFNPQENHHMPAIDFYTNGVIKYPWAEDAYYMFPTTYFKYRSWFLHEFEEEHPMNAGPLDIRFAASRDGVSWLRYDRRALVPLGMKNEFDAQSLYMCSGLVPGNGDKMYMYYFGRNYGHGWGRIDEHGERNNRLLKKAGLAPTKPICAISRVVFRRDGFISIRGDYTGGEFITPALRFTGNHLEINVDTSALGDLRVEIQDETGKYIPGYSLEDSDRVHTANEIRRIVTWRGKRDVNSLEGRPVRLRFVLRDTDLYAFQFTKSESNTSN